MARIKALLLAAAVCFPLQGVSAQKWKAELLPPEKGIRGLRFSKKPMPVKFLKRAGEVIPVVRVRGAFKRKDWALFWGPKRATIEPNAKGIFQFLTKLKGVETPLELGTVSPTGKFRKIRLVVRFEDWEKFKYARSGKKIKKERPKKRKRPINRPLHAMLSVGPTFFTYTETGVEDYWALFSSAKLFAGFRFWKRFDIALNGYFNVWPITASRTDVVARFLGLNARAGYTFPFVKAPWRLSILAGWYYTAMFVTSNAFGYRGAMGPQVFPVLRRQFGRYHSAMVYFKYSPIAGLFTLTDRELAAGGAYIYSLPNGHPLTISFDYANVSFELLINNAVRAASASSYS